MKMWIWFLIIVLVLISILGLALGLTLRHSSSSQTKGTGPAPLPPTEQDPTIKQPDISSLVPSISDKINTLRKRHQVGPLSFDPELGQLSQDWAFHMAKTGNFEHSLHPDVGENIYMSSYPNQSPKDVLEQAIDSWYGEVQSYDFSNPGFSMQTGHFTCLVWKGSSRYGIGVAITQDGRAYVCMNTSPEGNIRNEFQDNVFPSLDK